MTVSGWTKSSFHRLSSAAGDSNNGLFLGTLELLSKHNKVLEMHMRDIK